LSKLYNLISFSILHQILVTPVFNRFLESPPLAGFLKTYFIVSSALGAGNNKIGFIMRTAGELV
ncbi:MAG: hypothetical protein ACKO7R_06840, partial [Pseudanabaena sp.]